MTLQSRIAAILDTPVFGGQLYYIQHPNPDAATVTYAVYSIVGGETFSDLDGDKDTSRPRVQVSIYSTDAATLIAKVAAVKTAMKAANVLASTADLETTAAALFNTSASVPVDGFEPETLRYYSHCDFYCWNS